MGTDVADLSIVIFKTKANILSRKLASKGGFCVNLSTEREAADDGVRPEADAHFVQGQVF